ncbi:CmpA/NrtA family ABC transporter substrate-binding protein [Tumidithrix elongata RA019]|uniref:CmpA/NrtA family ABC transporter substrate-binding protein n=1 Tax=Tumidithrix elongata BACA0141 TaxID=2716417 RepID=A0AAW9Q3D5_9CYAN|nr:CmpA/NrtA family ABC transporter substrate-binding protein [Tumidithrix elongata RA019]
MRNFGTDIPETKAAKLGLIASMESAPLIVAKRRYYFAKYGMTEVELIDQPSSQRLYEQIEISGAKDGLDGGQVLSPLPELLNEGKLDKLSRKTPMYVLLRLNAQGSGIVLGQKFKKFGITIDGASLQPILYVTKALGKSFKCAVSAKRSSHELWLRYWLAAAGIHPDADVSIIEMPLSAMRSQLNSDNIDLVCTNDPWETEIIALKQGFTATTTGEIWENHPGATFAMRAAWVDQYPKATQALLMAIMEAQMWCDQPENHEEVCRLVASHIYPKFKIPPFKEINSRQIDLKNLVERIKGNFTYGDGRISRNSNLAIKFWSNQGVSVSYPFKSHDIWFLTENIRWGMLPPTLEVKEIVNAVNREDLWREAAKSLGVPDTVIPATTSRGIEIFFDGGRFDPERPDDYLQSLKIKNV